MQVGTTLDAMNFALAGSREGFGPFLGVYLQQKGFDPAATGLAMSLAGLAGLLATTPIGTLIDRIRAKRLGLALSVAGIAIGAVAVVMTRSIWVIGAAQVLIGISDTSIAPFVAAITLGLVGADAYGGRVSRNEAFNHAGNATNALLAAVLGYTFGLGFVALAIVVTAFAASAVVALISPSAINHGAASSGKADERSTFRALVQTPGLIMLAGTVMLFQTANGAMLPFLAQARAAAGGDPSITTGVMTVVSQVTMAGAALIVAPFARRRGHAIVMTAALAVVVLRCLTAHYAASWPLIIVVQVLEGLSMGLGGVAIPALVADVMSGTGRANAGLGAVMTAFGAGATFSPLLAGTIAKSFGFPASFLALGVVAIFALVLWAGRELMPAAWPRAELPQSDDGVPISPPA